MVGYDDMTLLKVYGILLLLNTIPSFATTEQIVDSDDGYTHTPGTCLLQGSCNKDLPCVHEAKEPIKPDNEHIELLKDACPMYADKSEVCCDKDQLEYFKKQLNVVKSIIGNCEACFWDFKALECGFFCDVNHSQFIQIKETNRTEDKTTVQGIRYFVTKAAAKRIFNACKNVRDSITGGIGIVYVCGEADCPQNTFYLKLGDNPYTKLKVEFVIADESPVTYIEPFSDKDVYDCNDKVNGKTCTCHDCEEKMCPMPVTKDSDKMWYYTLPTGLALGLMWIIVITCLTCCHRPSQPTSKGHKELLNVGNGEDNKAADLTSPTMVRHSNGEVPVNGYHGNGKISPPEDYEKKQPHTLSPKLSVASLYSPDLSVEDYEEESLIRKRDPLYRCWLNLGPRLGELWSNFVYDNPVKIVLICFMLAGLCSSGWYNFRITTDPVELWTADSSISRQNKYDYDGLFGTSYRACQLVVKQRSFSTIQVGKKVVNGVFKPEVLREVYDMMKSIESIKVGDVRYSDLCYKPLGEFNKTHPREDCATLSVFQWLDNDRDLLNNPEKYISRIELCTEASALPECLASFRGPSTTHYVLGGYDAVDLNYMDSTTLMVTFALDGSEDKIDDILKWETKMKDYLLEQIDHRTQLDIAFSTDRALEDEIDRASHADIFTIILSYILMFVYVGSTLGDFDSSVSGCFMHSKVLLGVGGVMIVLVSVVSALGVTSYAGLPTTLIVIEVIPFLILAVGVDNVYIMVQGIQRIVSEKIRRGETLNAGVIRGIISSMMKDVFPAMILSSFCQMVAFALGSLSFMPSVQNFAYNATIALLMNFILQSTLFLILIRLDLMRTVEKRLDILCCLKSKLKEPARGPTRWFIEDYFSKFLFANKWVSAFILILFSCFTSANIVLIPYLKLGLEPTMALPTDSYLLKYYDIVYNDYRIGPGMSFVFKSRNGSELDIYDDRIFGELVSNSNSLLKTIGKYGKSPEFEFIRGNGGSFMSSFSDNWLDTSSCCWNDRERFCSSIHDREGCDKCNIQNMSRETKYKYLQWFISDIPRTDGSGCSKGGAVSYSKSAVFGDSNNTVTAGRFTSSHGVLSASSYFISARQQALQLAEEVNANTELIEVYAYSGFYPYYEQYDTIIKELAMNLVITIIATFFVATVLLGFNLHASLCVMLSVTMCAVDMMGSMVYLDIPLNALSLVNLLLSVGIAVEFSANIVQAFTVSRESGRLNKAKDALVRTGPAIVSGIAMTNFVGVVVLAAAKSQLFVVFYFRMFFTINCLCVLHTIFFLPVFLGFLGEEN